MLLQLLAGMIEWSRFDRQFCLDRERDFRTRSYLGPHGGYPAKFPELFRRRLQGEPGGTQNRDQILDFTKKVDPSRSPRVADRCEISCYIGRCALMPFLVPRGPKICQKRSKNSNLGQNPGGCRSENPSLYPPVGGGSIGSLELFRIDCTSTPHACENSCGCT